MFKIIVLVIGLAVAGIVGVALTKPDSFTVERSIRIKSPPQAVFPLINDLRRWQDWSPWVQKDPAMISNYSGAQSGMGAVYEWDGNREVGQGRMEIINMSPPSNVEIKLDFIRPFVSSNTVNFSLRYDGDYTEATWHMLGPMPFMSKLVSVFTSMDALIGPDFETGLHRLKALAEG